MHKSVNYYKVNPHVSTIQIQKRNTVSTIELPPPAPQKDYHHPDLLVFASFLLFIVIVRLIYALYCKLYS